MFNLWNEIRFWGSLNEPERIFVRSFRLGRQVHRIALLRVYLQGCRTADEFDRLRELLNHCDFKRYEKQGYLNIILAEECKL